MAKMFSITVVEKGMDKFYAIDERLTKLLTSVISDQSRKLTEYVKQLYLSGPKGPYRLDKQSGDLYRGTVPLSVEVFGKRVIGGMEFGDTPYARIHIGGVGKVTTITPKRAKALAIPLGSNANWYTGRSDLISLHEFKQLSLWKRKGGRDAFLVEKVAGGIRPVFLLKKMVRQKTRVFPERIVQEYSSPVILTVEREVERYFGKD